MSSIEKLSRPIWQLAFSYFVAASRLLQQGAFPRLIDALKIVVANRQAHQTFYDPVAALAWIKSDLDASFYFQAAVMMIPANSSVAYVKIELDIARGRMVGPHTLTENDIAMVVTYECLHSIGTITEPLRDLAEGGIVWHGLRGGYMTINTIRHGFVDHIANAPNVVAEENTEPNDDANAEPNDDANGKENNETNAWAA